MVERSQKKTSLCIAFASTFLLLHILGYFSTITTTNTTIHFTSAQIVEEIRQLNPQAIAVIQKVLATKSNRHFPILLQLLDLSTSALPRNSKAELLSKRVDSQPQQPIHDMDRSNFNIWDIPRTDVYQDWKTPPGDLGSTLRENKRLGVVEAAKIEARLVVEAARLQLPIESKPMESSDKSIERNIEVTRFDRRVERDRGIQYNVLFHTKDRMPPKYTAVHLTRPFQALQISSIETTSNLMIHIIVAVENRTPQLLILMKSLSKMSKYITLVVIDHCSTDDNVRRVVERDVATKLKHTLYLLAPRSIVRFSRALMLDYGIREIYKQNKNAIFFTGTFKNRKNEKCSKIVSHLY